MSRSKRITKNQKEHFICFLEENKILLGGKINPIELSKINELWGLITTQLNSIGPPKTTKQWKETLSEMKTNVKRRARDIKYGYQGTGGGGPIKPLSDLEEKLLGLISKLSVEGSNLTEAGVPQTTNTANEGECSEAATTIEFEVLEEPFEIAEYFVSQPSDAVPNDEMEEKPNDGIEEKPSNRMKENENLIKKKKTQKKIKPKKNRVENALNTHDRHLQNLSNSNFAIAQAIRCLAREVNRLANKK